MKGSGGTSQPSQGTARPAPPRTLSAAGRGGRKANGSRRRTGARVLASASLPCAWLPRRRRGWPDAARRRRQQQQQGRGWSQRGRGRRGEEERGGCSFPAAALAGWEGRGDAPRDGGRGGSATGEGAPQEPLHGCWSPGPPPPPPLPQRLFQVGAPPRGGGGERGGRRL